MIDTTTIQSIIQAEHTTILEDYAWARRKMDTLLLLVAPYGTGTVSTSSTTVTGSGTTFTSSMVNSFIRIGSDTTYYRISAFGSATSLTIESALPTAAVAGSSYTIFKHIYELPSDFGRVTNAMSDIRLTEWSRPEIERIDPYRTVTGTRPEVYTIRGTDYPPVSNPAIPLFHIEFWPVPSSAQTIRIEYLKTNSLSASSDVPLYRSDVLVWKSAETAVFYLFGKTGDAAWSALADRYHSRYQESLQGAREDDMAKYSEASYVRDRAFTYGRGDDFDISHDSLWLR